MDSASRKKPFRFELNDVTPNVLLAISQKMNYKTFANLRQLSRGIQEFVDENIEEYDIRVPKVINTGRVEGRDGFLFQLADTPFFGINYKYPVVWPTCCFSGFHFKEIVIFSYYVDDFLLAKALKAIRSDNLCVTQYSQSLLPVIENLSYETLRICCDKENDRIDLNLLPRFKCKEITVMGCGSLIGNLLEKIVGFEVAVLLFPTQDEQTSPQLIKQIWRGENTGALKRVTISDFMVFEIDEIVERCFPSVVVWDPRHIDLESKPIQWDHFGEATFQYFQNLRVVVFQTTKHLMLLTIVQRQTVTLDLFGPEDVEGLTGEITKTFAHLSFKDKSPGVSEAVRKHWRREDHGNSIFDELALL